MLVVAETTAFLTGAVAAVATWHVRRRGRALVAWVAWPFACGALAWLFVAFVEQRNDGMADVAVGGRFFLMAAIEAVAVAWGFWQGRPIARLLARIFVPPRPRQVLSFLWHADGKIPPPLRDA